MSAASQRAIDAHGSTRAGLRRETNLFRLIPPHYQQLPRQSPAVSNHDRSNGDVQAPDADEQSNAGEIVSMPMIAHYECPIDRIDWQQVDGQIAINGAELSRPYDPAQQKYWAKPRLPRLHPHPSDLEVLEADADSLNERGDSSHRDEDDDDDSLDRFEITLFQTILCHDPPLQTVRLAMQHCPESLDLLFHRPSPLALVARFEASRDVIVYFLHETLKGMDLVGMVLSPIEWVAEGYIGYDSARVIIQNYPHEQFRRHCADKILVNEIVSIYDSPIRLGALEMDDLWDGSEDWWNESRRNVWRKLQLVLSKILQCRQRSRHDAGGDQEDNSGPLPQQALPKLQCLFQTASLCKRRRRRVDTGRSTSTFLQHCIGEAKLEPIYEILKDTRRWDPQQFRTCEDASIPTYPLHTMLGMYLLRPTNKKRKLWMESSDAITTENNHFSDIGILHNEVEPEPPQSEEMDQAKNAMKLMLEAYPEAVTLPDAKGMLPLHLAASRGWPTDTILSMHPAGVQHQSHPPTALYPFHACVMHWIAMEEEGIVSNNRQAGADGGSDESYEGAEDDRLDLLTGCYTLLREYPAAMIMK